ncbi:DeoR family transcriptional regulator, partial [Cetobacterium sp.]
MLMEERRQLILNEINIKNIVYVKDLAVRYSVTMETIRKDLEEIIFENQDIKKVYGGALKSSSSIIDESYNLRKELFSNEKTILAQKGVTLINDG